jgi:arylsulfatase A-like enzyme
MIWSPSLFPKGQRVDTIASHVDINPTIADLLGLPPRDSWDGRSLFSPHRVPRAYFYAANDDYLLGVRENDLKYIYNVTRGREELFDLSRDPDEIHNIAAVHPDTCRTLRQRLAAWKHHAAGRLAAARHEMEGRPVLAKEAALEPVLR